MSKIKDRLYRCDTEHADSDLPCDRTDCQICCPHDERDHGICLECGHEKDPGEYIDSLLDRLEDR